jgi:hypothetical protein
MKLIRFVVCVVLLLRACPAHAQEAIVVSPVPSLTANCVLQYNNGTGLLECNAIAAVSQPLTDSVGLIADNVDPTKILALQLSGLTASTTRTWTIPDANITIPSTIASLATNTFTGLQTLNGGLAATTGTFSSTLAVTGAVSLSATVTSITSSTTRTFVGFGSDSATSAIVASFYSNVSGRAATIQFSDANTYNTSIGGDTAGGFGVWVNRSPGVAGTKVFTISSGGGAQLGSPTGGDKGAGTLNAAAVYDDNVLLTDWVFDLAYDDAEQKKVVAQEPETPRIPRGPKRLYSLADVKAVTETERRLPWMPSKADFDQTRATGWMITSLWQGQEQQQLYLFEHDAALKALAGRLDQLEKSVAKEK